LSANIIFYNMVMCMMSFWQVTLMSYCADRKFTRIRGRGVPSLRSGRRGDLVVQLDVEVPTNLSAEEAELLVQFAEMRGESVTSPKDHGLFSRIRSAFQ